MRLEFLLWIAPPDVKASVLKRLAEEIQKRRDHLLHQERADIPPAIYPSIVKQWKESHLASC
jgi:hypothetical protein